MAKRRIYTIMFVVGMVLWGAVIALILTGIFTSESMLSGALSGFLVAAGLDAAYLWIRLDWWRSDETIRQLSGNNKFIATDLISKRTDSKVTLFLLVLVAIAQVLMPFVQGFNSNRVRDGMIFGGILAVLIPVSNWIARSKEKAQLKKFFGQNAQE